MKRIVVVRESAKQELKDACAWYEREQAGLGNRFVLAIERALESISAAPLQYPIAHRDVRRSLVRPFPYGVYFRIRNEEIHVLAVVHASRDPLRWLSRADEE